MKRRYKEWEIIIDRKKDRKRKRKERKHANKREIQWY